MLKRAAMGFAKMGGETKLAVYPDQMQ